VRGLPEGRREFPELLAHKLTPLSSLTINAIICPRRCGGMVPRTRATPPATRAQPAP
jgi:hypothetical protein